MEFFPTKLNINPRIYAYKEINNINVKGLIKIGFTTRTVSQRVKEQFPIQKPGKDPYKIVLDVSAMREDGSVFYDHDVFSYLKKKKVKNPAGEWFDCDLKTIEGAILAVKNRIENIENRIFDFKMRSEQEAAVNKTSRYLKLVKKEKNKKTPHFLWNAKMRFGKTFATYQLAKKEKWKKILILTFKPAVQNAWYEDLLLHKDFEGWQFVSKKNTSNKKIDKKKPIVCFGSFQDYLGKNKLGGIKVKNKWVHSINWDCIVLDEYHFGAWRENSKELIGIEGKKESNFIRGEGIDYFNEDIMPITTNFYLYLSGTPFRAISTGEFIENQIFNWSYSDEQYAKRNFRGKNNPYKSLPRIVMMTYKLPENIMKIATKGEFNEFDLNEFFYADGKNDNAKFKHVDEVQKWLDLIRGSLNEKYYDNLKQAKEKPILPFYNEKLRSNLNHLVWFLPNVSACFAMKNLLEKKQNIFYHDYKFIVAAGPKAGIGVDALKPVFKAMEDPVKTKTITFTCGKLTTGVTIKPWSGIFMLRNLSTPETYFQSAFRIQSPWSVNEEGKLQNGNVTNFKDECYIFDFAPERALKLISEYGTKLNIKTNNIEEKINEIIKFLPVICYDGSSMQEIDAAKILDIAMSGTTASLLARKWDDASLVNVDIDTLNRLLKDSEAIDALMNIESFRNLKEQITTIINKSEKINNIKKINDNSKNNENLKKELNKEEKERNNLKKQIRDKLLQFATRIPVFMYLTDFREQSLEDVIRKIEPGLFKKVTGLEIKDFDKLVSLGVFEKPKMNDAIYKFKRYEDSSLAYMGFAKTKENRIGLWDTVIQKKDFNKKFVEKKNR
jgi:hypothetical protein